MYELWPNRGTIPAFACRPEELNSNQHSYDSRCLSTDSNQVPPEQKYTDLPFVYKRKD
jgi:hypothetical protein